MFINCVEPHLRVWAPQPFRGQFLLPGVSEAEALRRQSGCLCRAAWPGAQSHRRPHDAGDWEILKSLYDGATACLDDRIGRWWRTCAGSICWTIRC